METAAVFSFYQERATETFRKKPFAFPLRAVQNGRLMQLPIMSDNAADDVVNPVAAEKPAAEANKFDEQATGQAGDAVVAAGIDDVLVAGTATGIESAAERQGDIRKRDVHIIGEIAGLDTVGGGVLPGEVAYCSIVADAHGTAGSGGDAPEYIGIARGEGVDEAGIGGDIAVVLAPAGGV